MFVSCPDSLRAAHNENYSSYPNIHNDMHGPMDDNLIPATIQNTHPFVARLPGVMGEVKCLNVIQRTRSSSKLKKKKVTELLEHTQIRIFLSLPLHIPPSTISYKPIFYTHANTRLLHYSTWSVDASTPGRCSLLIAD